jgi:hypothetical protein
MSGNLKRDCEDGKNIHHTIFNNGWPVGLVMPARQIRFHYWCPLGWIILGNNDQSSHITAILLIDDGSFR